MMRVMYSQMSQVYMHGRYGRSLPDTGTEHEGQRVAAGEGWQETAAQPLNRHRMRLLSPLKENVASRSHAAQMRPILPEDGALVANRFNSILGRGRL